MIRHLLCTMTLLAAPTLAAAAAAADEIRLFDGRPAPGARLEVADVEAAIGFDRAPVVVPKAARPLVPASDVRARRSPRHTQDDAVTLQWREAWQAGLRVVFDEPQDLRAYVEQGALEFDVRADDLARSGFHVAMDCGPDCGRRVNHLLASRALAGQGWQRLSFPLACFMRDGADFSRVRRAFVIESSGGGQLSVADVRLRRVGGPPSVSCPDWRTQSVTPVPLDEVWAIDWWRTRHEAKRAEAQALRAAGRPARVVFIGDSITHGWEDAGRRHWDRHFAPLGALNLGFGGDKTENVLWRLASGALDDLDPEVVVLMIGTNNTGDRRENPATTAAGVRRIIDTLHERLPRARVLLLAVFPRDEKPGTPLRRLNEAVNRHLAAMADGRRVHFLDIGPRLANADGTLSARILPDWLHLSDEGYALWAEALVPALQPLLARR